MRLVLQRVTRAKVTVESEGDFEEVGAIGPGVVVLVGIEGGDGLGQVDAAVDKLVGLRMFADERGRMNLACAAAGASFLIVSQFTLAANLTRGRRPSFDKAAPPAEAEALIKELVARLRQREVVVETGRFRANMAVELVNDGPVTFVIDFPSDSASA